METKIIGRVYKLVSSHTDEIYIGSTVYTLSDRLCRHKYDYKKYMDGKQHYITSFDILKYVDVKIEPIHEGEFDSLNELRRLEGSFIRNTSECINKTIAGRSKNTLNVTRIA